MKHNNQRLAVVTGASQGIGLAIAQTLSAKGFDIVLAGRSAAKLDAAKGLLPDNHSRAFCHKLDLQDLSSIDTFSTAILDYGRNIDVLVNCGGIYRRGSLLESPLEQLDELLATNVRGSLALSRALLPALAKARGDIVFINSTIVYSDGHGTGYFAASQHALKAVADALRAEVNKEGVRVLSVYPGRTATPRQETIHSDEDKSYRPERLLQATDVAEIVAACLVLPATAEVMDLRVRPRLPS